MAVSHVATQLWSHSGTGTNGYANADIPTSVAVGDLVFIEGFIDSDKGTALAGAGWSLLGSGPTLGWAGTAAVYWRRWAAGLPTSYTVSHGYAPAMVGNVSVYRGAQGMRDAATSTRDVGIATAPFVAPGVSGASGDIVFLVGIYARSDFLSTVTATSPTTTVRSSADACYVGEAAISTAGTTAAYTSNQSVPDCTTVAATICLPVAPLPATILTPAPGATLDLTGGGTITWRHNPAGVQGSASGAQSAYAMRRKIGVGAYEYWNAGTAAWGGTITWNTSTTQAVTFPSGKWADNTAYSVAVATQEAAGSNQGTFGADQLLNVAVPPTVSITAPSGSVITTSPTVTWTVTPAAGKSYTGWQVRIFDYGTYSASGFSADTSTPVWDSTPQASTWLTATVAGLSNSVTYRAYVTARQTGDQWGPWAYSEFAVAVDTPAAPALLVTPIYPAPLRAPDYYGGSYYG